MTELPRQESSAGKTAWKSCADKAAQESSTGKTAWKSRAGKQRWESRAGKYYRCGHMDDADGMTAGITEVEDESLRIARDQ